MTRRKRARCQRCVRPPSNVRCISRPIESASPKETEIEHKAAKRRQPEAEGIQPRESHIARSDNKGEKVVRKSEQDRHGQKKDHGCAVQGEHPFEDLRRKKIVVRTYKLEANDESLDPADDEEQQSVGDIEYPQPLVINGGHPFVERVDPWPTLNIDVSNCHRIR